MEEGEACAIGIQFLCIFFTICIIVGVAAWAFGGWVNIYNKLKGKGDKKNGKTKEGTFTLRDKGDP